MTTARPELPIPCSPQAKTPGESSQSGNGIIRNANFKLCKL